LKTIYNWIFYLITPLLLLKLWRRGKKAPAYRQRVAERFGFASKTLTTQQHTQPLWVHAVSVGEVMAIIPVIKLLIAKYPNLPVLLTTSTPTGAQRVEKIFSDNPLVLHQYCPYDQSGAVNRFINTHQPLGLLIVETELWPNMLAISKKKAIPIILANARMSEKSAKGYAKLANLTRNMLEHLDLLIAQSSNDGDRFKRLGLNESKLQVTGNIKFDLNIPEEARTQAQELRKKIGNRPIIILGSSHDTEEQGVMEQLPELWKLFPDLLLIVVPRHPERFDAVAELASHYSSRVIRRSEQKINANCQIYIGDTMGDLLMLYKSADIAIVGGSFVPLGGQSPIEPASCAKGVLMGPHQYNFSVACPELEASGALRSCETFANLLQHLTSLLADPVKMKLMGEKASRYVSSQRGATSALMQSIERVLLS
jgi:3-deoxy-D-manno-octulosonic-acid transferase